MIHTFRFDYGQMLTEAQRAAIQPHVRERLPDDVRYQTFTGDVLAILRAAPTVEIRISGEEVPATTWEQVVERLARIEAKLDAAPAVNERCNVVVPGLGVLEVRQVCVEQDCCTERLQKMLDCGWRILAICPQPDQRRPDYVLGRTAPEAAGAAYG